MTTPESTDEAIQDTSEEMEPTTTQQLFPDLAPLEDATGEEVVPEKIVSPVEPEAKTEEPPATETKNEERKYLTLEELDGIFIKTKVDGEERDVEAKDVLRSYQTDRYLTQRGQQLAEEYKQLEKAKDGLITQSKPEVTAGTEDEYVTDPLLETSTPEVAVLKQEVEMLKNNLSSISATMAPTVYEQSMKAIDAHLKGQGYDDFMEFRPGIESYFNTLTVEQRAALIEGDVINKYKDLKIAKMIKTQVETASKPAEERPAPTVVNINSGGGRPSGADEDDAKYAKALAKAQETGNFTEVLSMKGYL